MTYRSHRFLSALVLGAVFSLSPSLRAQERTPLSVRLELGPRGALGEERVKGALERELGRPVELVERDDAALELSIDEGGHLTARYERDAAAPLVREVELPADDARALEVLVLLSGNLSRDEASELIASLSEPEPAASPEPAPSAEATAAPAPVVEREWIDAPFNLSLFFPVDLLHRSEERRVAFELGLAYSRVGALSGFGANFGALHIDGPLEGMASGLLWTKVGGKTSGLSASIGVTQGGGGVDGVAMGGLLAADAGPVVGAQLSIGAAIAGNVEGVQAGGGLAMADDVVGSMTSIGASIVHGRAVGFVGSGGASLALGGTDGLIAAIGASVTRDVRGALLAGGAGVARDVQGVTFGGGANVARDVNGWALAGGANVVRDAEGLLFAGGMNVAHDFQGWMLAGAGNVAHDVDGWMLGTANVAYGKVNGLMLGAVNIADELDGAAIGAINIVGNGRVQPTFWSSTALPAHVAVKFLAGYTYSELGVGYDRESGDRDVLATEGGIGAHIPVHLPALGQLALEPGVHFSELLDDASFKRSLESNAHYRLRVTYRVASWLELFAGGGARHGLGGRAKGDAKPEAFGGVSFL